LQVIYGCAAFAKSVRNPKAFQNIFIKFITKDNQVTWARCLQYISVLVFFQMIGLYFARQEDAIKTKMEELQNSKKPTMEKVFNHYRKEVFAAFFSKKKGEKELFLLFQDSFGYTLLSKWLASVSVEGIGNYVDKRFRRTEQRPLEQPTTSKRKIAPTTSTEQRPTEQRPPEQPTTSKRKIAPTTSTVPKKAKSSAVVHTKHASTDNIIVIDDNKTVATPETFDARVSMLVNTEEHCFFSVTNTLRLYLQMMHAELRFDKLHVKTLQKVSIAIDIVSSTVQFVSLHVSCFC
jgi:hypothetical protein